MATLLDKELREARARTGLPPPEVRRLLREQVGLSQGQLAEALTRAGHPVSRVTVTRWESGARNPRGALLHAYLRVLDELRGELGRRT